MPSGKKPVNCAPCVKRKVQCDRLEPCGHCKRRKEDICEYRVPRANDRVNRPVNVSSHIERLEGYIRSLGGDPHLVEQNVDSGEASVGKSSTYGPNPRHTTHIKGTEGPLDTKSGLVEHDEQVTYIEAPMWYSWSTKPGEEAEALSSAQTQKAKPDSKALHTFSALLDPLFNLDSVSLHSVYPPARETIALWRKYLKNVHPLVMIFFDWEIEVIIHKAAQNPTRLTHEEQALVLATYFIATVSLSEEECLDLLHDSRYCLLDKFQKAVEDALLLAELVVTSDRLVLQAFILYLLAMRTRARPAALFSLTGIASRIAERMGLHRDSTTLGLSPLRSEERRRIWWQLQHIEIMTAQLTGNITMTIYADWDTQLPRNLEDHDFNPDMQTLPPDRHGLTTMSSCLWRYEILHMQRTMQQPDGVKGKGLSWMLSPQISLAEKDAMIDRVEKTLGEKFLQHCEPLIPLHVYIQIGVRALVLGARGVARQPALINAKISEMSAREREDFLEICMKSLEYYILSQKTEMLRGYNWYTESYHQWPAFVYIILEAHHRSSDNDAIITDIWALISKIYFIHPTLTTALHHPDITSIVRITLAAYQKRHVYILEQYRQHYNHTIRSNESSSINVSETGPEPEMEPQPPQWILDLRQKFNIPDSVVDSSTGLATGLAPASVPNNNDKSERLLPPDFDFDVIDWSFWENTGLDAVV